LTRARLEVSENIEEKRQKALVGVGEGFTRTITWKWYRKKKAHDHGVI